LSTSPVYWHPAGYELAMRLLYGRGFEDRYGAIRDVVPAGASVVDVCAGDCRVFAKYLRGHVGSYLALDANAGFVAAAARRGNSARQLDARRDPIPEADVVLLQASLYQFMPNHAALVDRLAASARKLLVIAEPVRNLAQSPNPLLAWIGRRSTKAAGADCALRFDEPLFDRFMTERFAGRVAASRLIANGREKLYCIRTSP
jgi:hypothetical protein